MAKFFSLEARSDSQKIGETRYRMSHLPSTTAIARTLLLAGILLATLLVTSQSFFPAFAQETLEPDEQDFYENSEDSVAVYTATDPEEENVSWSLDGVDKEDFSVDSGVLTFKEPPDYESPTNKGNATIDSESVPGDNTYYVTVVVQAGTGGDSTATEQPVEVAVKNVEEPGNLNMMTLQPKVDAEISPALSDDDGHTENDDTKVFGDEDAEWQWATSTSDTATWNDIKSADGGTIREYMPRKSDVGLYLRVTATYEDGSGEDDPFTDDVDESKDTISAVSANPVAAADYENARPKFKDRDTDKDGSQPDATFEVKEDLKSGSNVGDKIVASDTGADGNQETLRYVLEVENGDPVASDHTFVIDSASAQISLAANKKLDFDVAPTQYVFYVQAYDPSNIGAERDPDATPAAVDNRARVTIDVLNVDEAPTIDAADTAASDGLSAKSLAEFDSDDAATTPFDRSISTYTATDPEDDRNTARDLKWSLSGGDSSKFVLIRVEDNFEIDTNENTDDCDAPISNEANVTNDSKVLLCLKAPSDDLKEPADYESVDGNHIYDKLTVTVTDSDNMKTSRDVDVAITNVEEIGYIAFSHVQPQVNISFKGEHFDPDEKKTVKSRQWATSTSPNVNATWNDISGAASENYSPQARHLGPGDTYLRYTVEYTDGCGNETQECGDDSLTKIVAHPVNPATSTDSAPKFYSDSNGDNVITELALTIVEGTRAFVEDSGAATFYAQDADRDDLYLVLSLDSSEASNFSITGSGANPLGTIVLGADTNLADSVGRTQPIVLAVKEGAEIDYEDSTGDHVFTFTVKAKDPSGGTLGSLSVKVTVQQVDESPAVTTEEDSYSYEEDGTGNVATFAARDPEDGTSVTWSLAGSDKDDLSIASNGVLKFKSSPDREAPTDRAGTTGTPGAVPSDNVYEIVVQVTDTAGQTTGKRVKVTVTNKEEEGTIRLSTDQPKITLNEDGVSTARIIATLTDPDGRDNATLPLQRSSAPTFDPATCGDVQNDTDLTDQYNSTETASTTEWKWATSTSASGPWNIISGADQCNYSLKESDAGLYLRATATYRDESGVDDVDTKGDESVDMIEVVSAKVLMADYENEAPKFPDQEPDIPDVQNSTTTRKVFENAAPGTLVGDPVAFMDEGEDGSQETLFYTLTDPTSDIDDDKFFVIDSSTGKIRVSNAAADEDSKIDYESLRYSSYQDPPVDEDNANRVDYLYEVIVTATDPSNASSSSTKVIIKVLNVNEAPDGGRCDGDRRILSATTTHEATTTINHDLAAYKRRISV